MPRSDGLPFAPKRITKEREEKLRLQYKMLEDIYSRPMPTPEEEGVRAEHYNAGKQIGHYKASLHKVSGLLPMVERYVTFAPEHIQDHLYKEATYNLTKVPTAQAFMDLAKRVQDERQAAIQQGFEVPDPLDFSFPAPPGVLTQIELMRVKRARANSCSEE